MPPSNAFGNKIIFKGYFSSVQGLFRLRAIPFKGCPLGHSTARVALVLRAISRVCRFLQPVEGKLFN